MEIEVIERDYEYYHRKDDIIKSFDNIRGWFYGYEFGFSKLNEESMEYENYNGLEFFKDDESPEEFEIYLDYPLSCMAKATVKARTNLELAVRIADMHHQIYEEENESSTIPEGQASENLINRNRTNGKYGIWGHVLSDLVLEGLQIHEGNKVTVYVGS